MEQIHLGDQIIRHDDSRTRAAYVAMKSGSPERCGCVYCRNFAAQRSTLYPENFRRLLNELGIDPEKEGDVFEGGGLEASLVEYGGWFYLAGELVETGERMTEAGADFQYFFRRSHRPIALADFGDAVLALEFSARLPWVISDER
ncbi:MAG: hypothetical protein WB919_17110 [Candidatus Sulfotelmatobacter sp.]